MTELVKLKKGFVMMEPAAVLDCMLATEITVEVRNYYGNGENYTGEKNPAITKCRL